MLPSFSNLTNLSFLYLSKNSISADASLSCFSNLPSLITLDLSNNNITGQLPPDCLNNIPKLLTLSLAYNGFTGQLPYLEGTTYIVTLDIRYDQLTWIPFQFSFGFMCFRVLRFLYGIT